MKTSESIKNIAPALHAAQKLMGGATKGAKNPFFKSSYADYGSVLEACKDALNDNGITILQPHTANERGSFVETLLLHNSGEFISSETKIVFAKEGDPQAQGSAITYARRYGLQSLLSLPTEDDDGEKAMVRQPKQENQKPAQQAALSALKAEVVTAKPLSAPTTIAPKSSFKNTPKPEVEAKPAAAKELTW